MNSKRQSKFIQISFLKLISLLTQAIFLPILFIADQIKYFFIPSKYSKYLILDFLVHFYQKKKKKRLFG